MVDQDVLLEGNAAVFDNRQTASKFLGLPGGIKRNVEIVAPDGKRKLNGFCAVSETDGFDTGALWDVDKPFKTENGAHQPPQ